MEHIKTRAELRAAIRELEKERASAAIAVKNEVSGLYERFKPVNILKSTVQEINADAALKDQMFRAALTYGAGFISQKLIAGNSANPLRKLLGMVAQFLLSNTLLQNTDKIKEAVLQLFRKKGKHEELEEGSDEDLMLAECEACALVCEQCADTLSALNNKKMADCITQCRDCADMCRLVERMADKPEAAGLRKVCADLCKACADSCDKFASKHAVCKQCAAVCRNCAAALTKV